MIKKIFVIIFIGFAAIALYADTLYLKNGKVVKGTILKGDGKRITVIIEGKKETIDINREDIIKTEWSMNQNFSSVQTSQDELSEIQSAQYSKNKFMEKVNNMVDLIKNGNYKKFEKEMNILLVDTDENNDLICVIYGVISKIPNILEHLDKWCRDYPESSIAFTVRGFFYIEYAWKARGSDWARNVKNELWPIFFERLRMAEKDLETAYKLDPNNPYAPAELIIVARALPNKTYDDMEKQFQRAIKVSPYNIEAHRNKLIYIMPKWHGKSYEEMFNFARESAKKAPYGHNLKRIIVAAHEEMANRSGEPAKYYQQPHVWQEIKDAYEQCIEKHPNNFILHNYYAKYAVKCKKYDIAVKEFEIIKDNYIPLCWSSDEYYEEIKNRTYQYYAYSLYEKGRYQDAVYYLTEADRVKSGDAYTYRQLASCYNMLGDKNKTIEYTKRSLSIDPSQQDLKTWLDKIER